MIHITDYIEVLEFKANRTSVKDMMVFPKTPVLKDLESLFVSNGFRKVSFRPSTGFTQAIESLQ